MHEGFREADARLPSRHRNWLSECVCSESSETNSCRREWVQSCSPHPFSPGNEPGNESEAFKSLLWELLTLAIDAVAPTPNFSIVSLLLSLQRIEQQSIYFQGAIKNENSYISLKQSNQACS